MCIIARNKEGAQVGGREKGQRGICAPVHVIVQHLRLCCSLLLKHIGTLILELIHVILTPVAGAWLRMEFGCFCIGRQHRVGTQRTFNAPFQLD